MTEDCNIARYVCSSYIFNDFVQHYVLDVSSLDARDRFPAERPHRLYLEGHVPAVEQSLRLHQVKSRAEHQDGHGNTCDQRVQNAGLEDVYSSVLKSADSDKVCDGQEDEQQQPAQHALQLDPMLPVHQFDADRVAVTVSDAQFQIRFHGTGILCLPAIISVDRYLGFHFLALCTLQLKQTFTLMRYYRCFKKCRYDL